MLPAWGRDESLQENQRTTALDLEVLSFSLRSREYLFEIFSEQQHLFPLAELLHHFTDSAVDHILKVLLGDPVCEHSLLVLFHKTRCENFKVINKSSDQLGRLIHYLQEASICTFDMISQP